MVSIADVWGYDYEHLNADRDYKTNKFVENLFVYMSNFFSESGDGYQQRSLSMLEYSTDEVVDKLKSSYEKEPLKLEEADKGKFVVGSNGMHRFNVLKAHYLKELSMLDENDQIGKERLRKKYTIPAYVDEVDYVKTYSACIIGLLNNIQETKFEVSPEFDEKWQHTGNVVVKSLGDIEFKKVMNDEQLLKFVDYQFTNVLQENVHQPEVFEGMNRYIKLVIKGYASFERFYNQNISSAGAFAQIMENYEAQKQKEFEMAFPDIKNEPQVDEINNMDNEYLNLFYDGKDEYSNEINILDQQYENTYSSSTKELEENLKYLEEQNKIINNALKKLVKINNNPNDKHIER